MLKLNVDQKNYLKKSLFAAATLKTQEDQTRFVFMTLQPINRQNRTSLIVMLLIIFSLFSAYSNIKVDQREEVDTALQAHIVELIKDFRGDVGVYVRHLVTGKSVSIRADELFPTASMIKVPILVTLFDKIQKRELDYDSTLTYRDSLLYAGEDILGSFKDSSTILLSKVVMLMITMSDNTASLWLQHLAGTGTAINEWLDQNGFHMTRVNSRTPGRQADREKYGWGQTTPREIANLLVMINARKAVSPSASEEMSRVLSRIYWNGEALSQIPPNIQTLSKQGAVNRSRSEVVLVNAPSGDYVFALITKNQEDQSWVQENEGYVLIRKISQLLWNYFEPQSKWNPPADANKWRGY